MAVWEQDIEGRKKSHVDVCLNKEVAYHKSTGFEKYDFIHKALPEISFREIDVSTSFLKKTLAFPLIISGMTGGPRLAQKINTNLALAAEKMKVAMGLGSQRIAIDNAKMAASFRIREHAPSIPLLANLGAVQLNYGYGAGECLKAIELAGADALVFHLNSMQEIIQDGDTNYRNLLEKIGMICTELGWPVIVKEVGFGISGEVGEQLEQIGVYGIDVAGAGGTSFAAVESHLAKGKNKELGTMFWDWGIPTAACLEMNKGRKCKLIAGGGIRNGLEIAKAISLGADYVSMAGPLLKAALDSSGQVVSIIQGLELELKTAMFGLGVKNLEELKKTRALVKVK